LQVRHLDGAELQSHPLLDAATAFAPRLFGGFRLRSRKSVPVIAGTSSVLQWIGDDFLRACMHVDLVFC
jgi:hypothetical protein